MKNDLRKMKSRKARGEDGIVVGAIKIEDVLLEKIENLFNL